MGLNVKPEAAAMMVVFQTQLERQWMRRLMKERVKEIDQALTHLGNTDGVQHLARLGVELYQDERDFLIRQLEELSRCENRRVTR